MESEIFQVAEDALGQAGVTGFMCVDSDGLCITAKGQANESMSGIINQIADLACRIEDPGTNSKTAVKRDPPVIRVDLERHKMLIQSRDSITTALISPQK